MACRKRVKQHKRHWKKRCCEKERCAIERDRTVYLSRIAIERIQRLDEAGNNRNEAQYN